MNKIRLFLLIFLIISLSGCTPKGCSFLPRASLLILSHHFEKSVDEEGELTAQITGVARNTSAAELQYAEVIGKFYGKAGTLLYSGVDSTTNLGPGQIWEFTIPYPATREAHPSLKILSCKLEKVGSTVKAFGWVQNDGDVMLSYARITVTFYNAAGSALPSTATTSIVDLEVGETREYGVFYQGSDYKLVQQATAEVDELTEEVDHATVEVGALRGRSVMP